VPKGVSQIHVRAIHAAMMKALAIPELQQRFVENGVAAAPQTPEEFMKFTKDETAKWQKAITVSGAKVE
jgi:tripartite-type tricarboxylate transporter receptor subunit TctC